MIRRLACLLAFATTLGSRAQAQSTIHVAYAGPESAARVLSAAIAGPHTVLPPASDARTIPHDSTYSNTVIALGGNVIVEGTVHGDLIVVGGDVTMHPGGHVDGHAIAFGGGVYESMLAHTGGIQAYRDFTYDIAPSAGGYTLTYRALDVAEPIAVVGFTGIQGFSIPSYDRTNGLSLPIGAFAVIPGTSVRVEPRLTYRSQLGRIDPYATVTSPIGSRTAVMLEAGRGTYSNDTWIWSDLVNSAEYLLVGDDTRNYYRATRAQGVVSRQLSADTSGLAAYIGARAERANSVRPGAGAAGGPWAFTNRHDGDDVLRPNPEIDSGTTTSFLAGAHWSASANTIVARASLDEEIGHFSGKPGFLTTAGGTFAQTTVDGSVTFPTFGTQTLRIDGHGVFTGGADPRQRWSYVGGPGTLRTLDLLGRGGDELVYLDGRYAIPVDRVVLPLVGSPVLTLREILAGATVNGFPTLSQGTGFRVSASVLYFELIVDPSSGRGGWGFGLSLSR